jgi:hypothetical protein
MVLAVGIVELIRDEVGPDLDFANNTSELIAGQLDSLENIYTNSNRGSTSVLRTALICWRLRRADYVKRGFDASTAGTLMARRQKLREYNRIVKEYELLVDTTAKHVNSTIQSTHQQSEALAESGAEF